ncbi:hypothetical protein LWI28_019997 [Acer negundo]|uniref:Uncharacterized protein n=1 Tax=Acer negundo TaxID=4023 RepID=A0AAD5IMF7_ACENE|nr:hypothetical protein LWI28_019997 [Acer negundo]
MVLGRLPPVLHSLGVYRSEPALIADLSRSGNFWFCGHGLSGICSVAFCSFYPAECSCASAFGVGRLCWLSRTFFPMNGLGVCNCQKVLLAELEYMGRLIRHSLVGRFDVLYLFGLVVPGRPPIPPKYCGKLHARGSLSLPYFVGVSSREALLLAQCRPALLYFELLQQLEGEHSPRDIVPRTMSSVEVSFSVLSGPPTEGRAVAFDVGCISTDNVVVETFARSMVVEVSAGRMAGTLGNRDDIPVVDIAFDMDNIRSVVAVVLGPLTVVAVSTALLPFQALAGIAGVVAAAHSLDPWADIV